MKNLNRPKNLKDKLIERWSDEDYPGGKPRFQAGLMFKDVLVFVAVPIFAVILFKVFESGMNSPVKIVPERRRIDQNDLNNKKSQIISFTSSKSNRSLIGRKAPGTVAKVRLLNTVETFSTAPVHAQVLDDSLGAQFKGGTLLGDAITDSGSGRISITFRFLKHPYRADLAIPIAARAMSLDGTFGVVGTKKEGFFARAAISSASTNSGSIDTGSEKQDLKTLVARAVAAGMMREFQNEASVAHNNAQVLILKPMTEFFVELTDYFPGQH